MKKIQLLIIYLAIAMSIATFGFIGFIITFDTKEIWIENPMGDMVKEQYWILRSFLWFLVFFIFSLNNEDGIKVDALKSRCYKYHFKPPTDREIFDWFVDINNFSCLH